jgi:hypothetical protein
MVVIDSVSFGEVKVNGVTHYSDVVAWWDDSIEEVEKVRIFDAEFFYRIMKRKPEIVIVAKGLGDFVKVDYDVHILAKESNVMFFSDTMKKSLEMFESFVNNGKKAVIVIHNM